MSLFSNLMVRLRAVVDNHFGVVTLLKQRVFGSEERLKEHVRTAVEEVELEAHLDSIVDEAAKSL